jgi:hypothetical protein
MNIPAEFSHRVYKTKLSGLSRDFKRLDQIRKEWQGSEIDVVYENLSPIVVVVFESPEDCLAFTLKYGNEYV